MLTDKQKIMLMKVRDRLERLKDQIFEDRYMHFGERMDICKEISKLMKVIKRIGLGTYEERVQEARRYQCKRKKKRREIKI